MKTIATTNLGGTRRSEIIRANPDNREALACMRSALSGLLQANSVYDPDSLSFRDKLEPEELLTQAEAYGLELFEKWREGGKEKEQTRGPKADKKVKSKRQGKHSNQKKKIGWGQKVLNLSETY